MRLDAVSLGNASPKGLRMLGTWGYTALRWRGKFSEEGVLVLRGMMDVVLG